MIQRILNSPPEREDHWISISDMMSGLMMIFLFVSVLYMINVQKEKREIENVAQTYESLQLDLYNDLYEEFKYDLERWIAEIDKETLSVRFNEPEILFEPGESEINANFQEILSNFFPRYIRLLAQDKYRDSIEEIRIEGHTSSEWGDETGINAYLKNMELSQDRTRSVLDFVIHLDSLNIERQWIIEHLTANGLSSSKLIMRNGVEDKKRSRRVEFRVRTNSEEQIYKIIQR